MRDAIIIEPYSPEWQVLFEDLGRRLRATIGDTALRIDHIGSTSIPGLAAKPIIDIQISVATFDPMGNYRLPLETIGIVFREGNPESQNGISVSRQGNGRPTSTSDEQAASRSSSRCSSETTCAATKTTPGNMAI